MEQIIRDLVDADKQARKRVKDKQIERLEIQKKIQERNDEIKRHYQEETHELLASKREELQTNLETLKQEEEQAYQIALNNLQAKYDAEKEGWINEIVRRCLAI